METLTEFQDWLDEIDLSDYEDVYSLYRSVNENEEFGMFKTDIAKNGQIIVSCSIIDDKLRLCSEKAKKAFLHLLETKYCEGMDIESWYGFNHAMEKDD